MVQLRWILLHHRHTGIDKERQWDSEDSVFYPRRHCPHCCSDALTWQEISGQATLCSFTLARIPTLPEFAQPAPQNLAIVTLAEGFNMNSALVGVEASAMRIGMALRPVFDVIDNSGATRLLFTAADS